MRLTIVIVASLIALYVGEVFYRTFLRPADQPTETLRALAVHFRASALPGRLYPVRHGFPHSSVTAVAGYMITDFPLSFTVVDCPSIAAAEIRLLARSPEWQSLRHHSLVISFAMWGDDTGAMMDRVKAAFLTYEPLP